MKLRMILILGLLGSSTPALAQASNGSIHSVISGAPAAPRAPEAPPAPATYEAAIASLPEAPPAPPLPPAPPEAGELSQRPPKPPAPPAAPSAAPPPVPAAPPAPPAPGAAPAPPAPPAPRPMGQMINIRIDVTLSDSKGAPKVLTMTVADGESGMNRTTSVGSTDYSFNADARPMVFGNRVRLSLTADAVVPVEGEKMADGRVPKLGLRQSQTIVLNDGESVEVARAADPTSDRSFALTVKATILR